MGEEFYDKKITCPLCETVYTTKKVLSRYIRVKRTEGDFYCEYEGVNPNHYLVNVCPHCGFSFLDKMEPKKIISNTRNRYIDEVASRWVSRDFGNGRSVKEALVAYKLATFCAQYLDVPSKTVATLCLHLVWLYRELDRREEEQRFLQDALDFYLDAYMHDAMIESDGHLTYLLGELYRRLGDEQQAIHFFNQVIHDKSAKPKYVRKARDQWALIREQQKSGLRKG